MVLRFYVTTFLLITRMDEAILENVYRDCDDWTSLILNSSLVLLERRCDSRGLSFVTLECPMKSH